MDSNLSVREIQESDVEQLCDYWFNSDDESLKAMGVDLSKMPNRADFSKMILNQLDKPYNEKPAYALIWLMNDKPVGHCNVNKIVFAEEAYMHLHMWKTDDRRKGVGSQFVSLSIPFFFKNLELKTLYCEPYALNIAPNKTLARLGFQKVKQYSTIPGFINFEQEVIQWKMDKAEFLNLGFSNE